MTHPEAPEIIGQGREPARRPTPRRPWLRGVRAAAYVGAAAVAAGAIWSVARPHPERVGAPAAPSTAVATTRTVYPTPAGAVLSLQHDLTVSPLPGQRSYIAFGGHVLLFLQVTYAGPGSVRVVDGSVPQVGAFPDAGAGGLTAGTTENGALVHGVPAEVFVRSRVDCAQVLAEPAVGNLELTVERDGGPPRAEFLDLTLLGGYWNDARHAACSPADAATAITVGIDPGSVTGVRAQGGKRPWVDAVLSLHNAAGLQAVTVPLPTAPPGLTEQLPALTSAGTAIDGGSSYLTPVRWVVTDCALAEAGPAPSLPFEVTVADSQARIDWTQDAAWAAEWTTGLAEACG